MKPSALPVDEPVHEPCVVIGAGPVGLIAALALRRRGVDVLVVEAEPQDRRRPDSRALVLAYPTLRRLDAVLPAPDHAAARRLIHRCATDRRQWGLRNRAVSNRALRIMRADDPRMRARRTLAARLAPAFWPAGAWLATGPLQLPLPRLRPAGMY